MEVCQQISNSVRLLRRLDTRQRKLGKFNFYDCQECKSTAAERNNGAVWLENEFQYITNLRGY